MFDKLYSPPSFSWWSASMNSFLRSFWCTSWNCIRWQYSFCKKWNNLKQSLKKKDQNKNSTWIIVVRYFHFWHQHKQYVVYFFKTSFNKKFWFLNLQTANILFSFSLEKIFASFLGFFVCLSTYYFCFRIGYHF